MTKYKIQEISENYLAETLELIFNVFMEFEGIEYSQKGIIEFKDYIKKDNITKLLNDNLKMWIALYNDKVIGIIASRNVNHISLFFVDKHYHRQGIGSKLFELVLNDCIIHNKNEITVNSSPYARIIYTKLGFEKTNTEQIVNGINFIPMKRILNND